MKNVSYIHWLLAISCLALSACTEKTVIHEAPATLSDATQASDPLVGAQAPTIYDVTTAPATPATPATPETPVVTGPVANMVDENQPSSVQPADTPLTTDPGNVTPPVPDNGLLSDPVSPTTPSSQPESPIPVPQTPGTSPAVNLVVSDPDAPATIGSPGMSVNCAQTLPCRWISADTQFSVTVSNVDNIGEQGRLSIEYSLLTSHDTQISIASTEPAIDESGVRYEPSALTLGEGIGGKAQGVFAGTQVAARIEFDRESVSDTLSRWTIGLSDAGLVRQPVFTGLPVGSATRQHADCENVLPCVWISPDMQTTITLLSANGFGSTNRLSTNFTVETTRNTVVAIDSGATAVGIDGLSYKGRTHAIGLDTGAEKIVATAIPGAQVAGTVFFFRTQSMSTALQNLSLVVYEDRPVPRWNPSFLAVPIQ